MVTVKTAFNCTLSIALTFSLKYNLSLFYLKRGANISYTLRRKVYLKD